MNPAYIIPSWALNLTHSSYSMTNDFEKKSYFCPKASSDPGAGLLLLTTHGKGRVSGDVARCGPRARAQISLQLMVQSPGWAGSRA